jgi:hypothetical protein
MIRQKKRQHGVLIISTYPDEESVVKVAKMMPSFFTCWKLQYGQTKNLLLYLAKYFSTPCIIGERIRVLIHVL